MKTLNNTDFKQYLSEKKDLVDKYLDKYLPKKLDYPPVLHEAMRYSIFAGGKRFRPILAIVACEACGGKFEDVISTACALEIIHTYSLIHDDLPAMDNDNYRRGRLSNHKKYGEDVAILTGDALLSLAFEIMDKEVVKEIASAIGSLGVVGGQVVDMQLLRGEIEMDLPLIDYIHSHKTGALIAVSCKVGAMLANVSDEIVNAIDHYGKNIGFAFQIVDDIFDNDNYAVLMGKEKSRENALIYVDKAKKYLDCLEKEQQQVLVELADYVVSRTE